MSRPAVTVSIPEETSHEPFRKRSPKFTRDADSRSPLSSASRRRETLLPPIESNDQQISVAARNITSIFAKTLASKASSTRPNDALALGAYASLLTNKFKRKQSQAASYNSASSLVHHHYQTTELPTYRLGPLSKQTVRWARLQIMVDSILTDFINRGVYNKTRASHSAKNISANIKTLAKELGYSKRYKMVATVEIGQNTGQEFTSSSRCLWNTDLDGFVTSYKKCPAVFIVATLYLVYTD